MVFSRLNITYCCSAITAANILKIRHNGHVTYTPSVVIWAGTDGRLMTSRLPAATMTSYVVDASTSVKITDRSCTTCSRTVFTPPAQCAQQGLGNGPVSVRRSVHLSHLSTAAAACGGFAAGRPADRRYRSIDSGGRRAARSTYSAFAFSSKCEQCRVYSRRRRLNTDLFGSCRHF